MIALFLDTNVLLHFKTFDEVDWRKLAGGDCEIIIAPVVIDEIDKHKNNPNNKIAQRARMIAGKFEQLIDEEESDMAVHFMTRRPGPEYFEAHQLDAKHQDDQLFAALLQYQELNVDKTVKLVSADVGVKLKAKTLGAPVIKPGEELRLPETPDKNSKEAERLQRELSDLKKRMPEVTLVFDNGTVRFEKEVVTNIKTYEQFLEEEMYKVLQHYPIPKNPEFDVEGKTEEEFKAFFEGQSPEGLTAIRERHKVWSATKEGRYAKKIFDYYAEYEWYIRKTYDHSISELRTFSLTFQLKNDGTLPAEDIDVWLHLPGGFKLIDSLPQAPKPPLPPNVSASLLDPAYWPVSERAVFEDPDDEANGANGHELSYHCKALKHGYTYGFKPVILQYASFEAMRNFTIDYRLNIANVPTPVVGQLHVLITQPK